MKVEQTSTGLIKCVKHNCRVKFEDERVYCPKCRVEREQKLNNNQQVNNN